MAHPALTEPDRREQDRRFAEEALRWLPDVTRYALSLTRDEANADDLVQETFLRAYRAWGTFTPGTEARAWLFTICRNLFLRTAKRESRQVPTEDAELETLAAVTDHARSQEAGLGDLFGRLDVGPAIERAIAELPEVFRDAVILVDVQDQSYQDAARVLGVPVGTVRSRLFRARRLLQQALVEHARDAGLAPPTAPAPAPEPSR